MQTSRNPGIPQIWLVFAYYNVQGIFPTQFFPELNFECKIPKFYHSWNLPGTIWNSGIPLGNDLFFAKFIQGVFPMQFLALNLIFNPGLHTQRNPGVSQNQLAFATFKVQGIIPIQYSSIYTIFDFSIQNSILFEIFLELYGTLEMACFLPRNSRVSLCV